MLFVEPPNRKKRSRRSNKRIKLLEQDPSCHFCGGEVNYENSGIFKINANGAKEKVLACLECIYKHRREDSGGRSTRRRQRLLDENPHCFYCNCDLSLENSTLDHLVPRAQKGPNKSGNIVLSCYTCNHRKGTKSAAQYLAILNAEKRRIA